eukprot:scaffold309036_cov48-Prasinocladus_malaysianus.AAC.1
MKRPPDSSRPAPPNVVPAQPPLSIVRVPTSLQKAREKDEARREKNRVAVRRHRQRRQEETAINGSHAHIHSVMQRVSISMTHFYAS